MNIIRGRKNNINEENLTISFNTMELNEILQFIEVQEKRLQQYFPEQLSNKEKRLFAHTIKLSEEVGELSEAVLASTNTQRKQKMTSKHTDIGEEVADVIITTLILAQSYEIDIEKTLEQKIKKINERFKNIPK